jgi:hypothetical protein
MDKRWGGKQTKVEAHGQGLVLPGHARDVDDGTEKGTGPLAARPGGCATRSSIEKLRQTDHQACSFRSPGEQSSSVILVVEIGLVTGRRTTLSFIINSNQYMLP